MESEDTRRTTAPDGKRRRNGRNRRTTAPDGKAKTRRITTGQSNAAGQLHQLTRRRTKTRREVGRVGGRADSCKRRHEGWSRTHLRTAARRRSNADSCTTGGRIGCRHEADASCTAERRESCTAKHAQGANCASCTAVQPNGEKAARQNTHKAQAVQQNDAKARSDATDGQPRTVGRCTATCGRLVGRNRRAAERCTATGGGIQPMGHVRRARRTVGRNRRAAERYNRNPDNCAAERSIPDSCTAERSTGRNPDSCTSRTTNEGAYIERSSERNPDSRTAVQPGKDRRSACTSDSTNEDGTDGLPARRLRTAQTKTAPTTVCLHVACTSDSTNEDDTTVWDSTNEDDTTVCRTAGQLNGERPQTNGREDRKSRRT